MRRTGLKESHNEVHNCCRFVAHAVSLIDVSKATSLLLYSKVQPSEFRFKKHGLYGLKQNFGHARSGPFGGHAESNWSMLSMAPGATYRERPTVKQ